MKQPKHRDRNRTSTDLRHDRDILREGPFSRASREWELVVPARKQKQPPLSR